LSRAKIAGALNLDELFTNASLDFFVLYGSVSSFVSAPWFASYSAGNAFLEALAERRRERGLPALCVAWGLWVDGEQALGVARAARGKITQRGVPHIDPASAFEALRYLLPRSNANVVVTKIDWALFRTYHALTASSPLMVEIAAPQRAAAPESGDVLGQ